MMDVESEQLSGSAGRVAAAVRLTALLYGPTEHVMAQSRAGSERSWVSQAPSRRSPSSISVSLVVVETDRI